MKQIVTILLILGIFSQSIGKLVLFSSYQINKDFITLKFCENKSKPKLHCNGLCHLKKQIKKQESQENTSKKNIKVIEIVQLFNICDTFITPELIYFSVIPRWNQLIGKTMAISYDIFHPPIV